MDPTGLALREISEYGYKVVSRTRATCFQGTPTIEWMSPFAFSEWMSQGGLSLLLVGGTVCVPRNCGSLYERLRHKLYG